RLVVRRGAALAGVGIALGLAGAAAAAKLIAGLVYGVSARDPLTYAAVALGLGAVALGASWAPARRAGRVDPLVALRAE
ncbi:MAG TPA: hypothetical protein VNA89_04875, partial [Gemmatimonadaceae bacterium]|nr:hypothetical protein [Gemmatimonadaceae bacterium]